MTWLKQKLWLYLIRNGVELPLPGNMKVIAGPTQIILEKTHEME